MIVIFIPFLLFSAFKLIEKENITSYFMFAFINGTCLFLYYAILMKFVPHLIRGITKKMPSVFIEFLDSGNIQE